MLSADIPAHIVRTSCRSFEVSSCRMWRPLLLPYAGNVSGISRSNGICQRHEPEIPFSYKMNWKIPSYDNTVAMVDLMLGNLSGPAGEFLSLLLPCKIIIFHFYILISGGFSHACQGQAAFLCLIRVAMPTQPSRCAFNVSMRSRPTCRSSFVAGTDF